MKHILPIGLIACLALTPLGVQAEETTDTTAAATTDAVTSPTETTAAAVAVSTTVTEAPAEAPGEAFLKTLDAEMLAELKENGVVIRQDIDDDEESSAGMARAVVVFKQDPKTVLKLLTDTDRMQEYVTVLDRVTGIKRTATTSLDEEEFSVMFVTMTNRVQHYWDYDQLKMWWELDKEFDNSFNFQTGYWQLYALNNGHTVADYGTKIDVGLFVPNFIQESLTRSDLPESLGMIRTWVDSGGTAKIDD